MSKKILVYSKDNIFHIIRDKKLISYKKEEGDFKMPAGIKKKFNSAIKKVEKYLNKHNVKLKKCEIIVDPELDKEYVFKKGYPCNIMIKKKNISEAKLAYYIIDIAQNKVITPVNIKYLYTLLTEGLSDYIIDSIYSRYNISNSLGYKFVKLLKESELMQESNDIIKELLQLSYIKVRDEDVDKLLDSEKVREEFKKIIRPRQGMVKRALQVTDELDLAKSNYLPFGEELKSWMFIIDPKFNNIRENIDKILEKYYSE